MRLYTSRFSNKGLREHPDLVKVRISVGAPRWNVGYPIEAKSNTLPPQWMVVKRVKGAEFRAYYLQKLDSTGVEPILAELEKISAEHEGRDLVLLCFEDVIKGESCHRRIFAEWWLEHTGEAVVELESVESEAYRPNGKERAAEPEALVQGVLL